MNNPTIMHAAIGKLYCRLMEEIIVRDELIQNAMINFIPPVSGMKYMPEMRNIVLVEFCYLQLRMICELIALACLTAHGDIAASHSKEFRKSRKADWIIKALENLHPNFYPAAGKQHLDAAGKIIGRIKLTDGFLTKKELLQLYYECGQILHRGSITE